MVQEDARPRCHRHDRAFQRLAAGVVRLLEFSKYVAEGGIDGGHLGRVRYDWVLGHARKPDACPNIVSHLEDAPPLGNAKMSSVPSAWRRYIRPQDFVWLLLFSALAAFRPGRQPATRSRSVCSRHWAWCRCLEPRIGALGCRLVLKLALCYLLIGLSGGVASSFYLTLLLPVITAATTFGLTGMALISLAACAEYFSFLVFLQEGQYIPQHRQY